MEPQELRSAMKTLGLSYAETARILCVSIETVRSWRYGRNPIPPYMARIVRLLAWRIISIEQWETVAERPRPVVDEPIRPPTARAARAP